MNTHKQKDQINDIEQMEAIESYQNSASAQNFSLSDIKNQLVLADIIDKYPPEFTQFLMDNDLDQIIDISQMEKYANLGNSIAWWWSTVNENIAFDFDKTNNIKVARSLSIDMSSKDLIQIGIFYAHLAFLGDEFHDENLSFIHQSVKVRHTSAFYILRDLAGCFFYTKGDSVWTGKDLIEIAEKGDVHAIYRLALLTNNNEMMKKASDLNYPPAQYKYGRMTQNDELIRKSAELHYHFAEAFLEFNDNNLTDEEIAARINQSSDYLRLAGLFNYFGEYVKVNHSNAEKLFLQSESFFELGMMNLFKIPWDVEKAADYFKKGAEKNDFRSILANIIVRCFILNEDFSDYYELLGDSIFEKYLKGEIDSSVDETIYPGLSMAFGRDAALGNSNVKRNQYKAIRLLNYANHHGIDDAKIYLQYLPQELDYHEPCPNFSELDGSQLYEEGLHYKIGDIYDQDISKANELFEMSANCGFNKGKYEYACYLQYTKNELQEAFNIFSTMNDTDSIIQQAIIANSLEGQSKMQSILETIIRTKNPRALYLFGKTVESPKREKFIELAENQGSVDAEFDSLVSPNLRQDILKKRCTTNSTPLKLAILMIRSIEEETPNNSEVIPALFAKYYIDLKLMNGGMGFDQFFNEIYSIPRHYYDVTYVPPKDNGICKDIGSYAPILSFLGHPGAQLLNPVSNGFEFILNLPLSKAKLSADQNYPPALYYIGDCYRVGFILPKNYDLALKYIQKASNMGYEPAHLLLSQIKESDYIDTNMSSLELYDFKIPVFYEDREIRENKQVTKGEAIERAAEGNDHDAIFDYATALLYGDGVEKDVEKAKEQFLRIRDEVPAAFILRNRFNCPIKPIYRRKMTKKEEYFVTGSIDDINDCCCCNNDCNCYCCCNNECDINNCWLVNFFQQIISVNTLILAAISIIKTFQSMSLTVISNKLHISFDETIIKIYNWSTNIFQIISNALKINKIDPWNYNLFYSMVLLISISFFFIGAKRGFLRLICSILSQLIILPIGISIGMHNWLMLGIFLGYYFIIYPIVWLIAYRINKSRKKWLHIFMVIFYIPSTLIGFLLSFFYISIIGRCRKLVQKLMPWMRIFNLDRINQFYAEEYIYFNRSKIIDNNSASSLGSMLIVLIIFDLLSLYILKLNWLWYILVFIGVVLFILFVIEIVRKVYIVSVTMIYLSFYLMVALIKLFDIIIMPAISLFVDNDPSLIPDHTKAAISIFSVVIPLIVITIITVLLILQSKSYHPVLFRGWLGTSVTVGMIVDGYKYNCLWFPIVNYVYSIIFSILTAFTRPYYCIALSFIFVIFVIIVRPSIFPVDNIITCGEPIILILYNIVLLTKKEMPFWAAVVIAILAFIPSISCIFVYYLYQKKREWMITKNDIVKEMLRRTQPIPFIDESKRCKIFDFTSNSLYFEAKNYKFLLYHSSITPEDVLLMDEDDFPSSNCFLKKNIDARSDLYIDIFIMITLSLGSLFMFIEFGYAI